MSQQVDVLIVDDERINLYLLEGILKGLNLNIVKASSGKEALDQIKNHDFSVILLDVMMPEMDGFTTAEKIRTQPASKHIPIIFVTAISKEQTHIFRGYKLGAVDYLFKPVEPKILKSKVHIFVDLHKTAKKLEETIVKLQKSQKSLESSERRYRTIADYNYDWEGWVDPTGVPIYISPSCERISGYPPEKFMDSPNFFRELIHPEDVVLWDQFIKQCPPSEEDSLDFRIYDATHTIHWLRLVQREVIDKNGVSLGIRSSLRDITNRKKIEELLQHQSLHDPLTGLANRVLFIDRVNQTLSRASAEGKWVAVALIDLDRFKLINDSMGHTLGDQLLVAVARRLKSLVSPHDTVSRFGGDEYALLLENMNSKDEILTLVSTIVQKIKEPFHIEGHEICTSISLGVETVFSNRKNAEEHIRNAHTALYVAKASGKDDYYVFKEKMREQAVKKMAIETELRLALERNEFTLFYQPIINLKSNVIHSFEALIRWQHPEKGLITPGGFIQVAEETGLIVDIGEWVLHEATTTLKEWHQNNVLSIAVNLSAKQFQEHGLVSNVQHILNNASIPPNRLKLEITESVVMLDAFDSVQKLNSLKNLGLSLSVDDFGTGYSSMSYLQRFPIDQLKVDLSFVQRLGVEESSLEIVRAIINLAHGLNLEVVAEGIETKEQLQLLNSLNCNYGQGYLFSKPLPREQALAFLQNTNGLHHPSTA